MTDDIPVPDDVDREAYLRGYQDALGMVREACAMLEVTGTTDSAADADRSDDETDSTDECPDCGAALRPELGGRRCPACGYQDDQPIESSDEPDLSDMINNP